MRIKMRLFLFCVLLAGTMLHAKAFAQMKKNVCSITINSNHEINAFKKTLSKDKWNYIELTDYQPERSSDETAWFKSACREKVSCDLLIISGHFAGTFFGQSDFRLPIEELELNTCNQACNGIINNPKEVFLFGCNTLASKDKDMRTPEEYLQVLIEDGFSNEQARQVVAFRYSDFGDSFKSRMAQVFTNTPRIYGFSSKGPSGKNVDTPLKNYLKDSKADYENFSESSEQAGVEKNEKLFSALKGSAIAQTAGMSFLDAERAKSERPYCYLSNEKNSRKDKLLYIKQVLSAGRALTIIPYIKKYITEIKGQNPTLPSEVKTLLGDLKSNQKVMNDFKKILSLDNRTYFKIKMDIIVLMKDLSMITESEYADQIKKVVDFNKEITLEQKDRICSSGVQLDVEPSMVPESNWQKEDFYGVLGCLKPMNYSIHKKLLDVLQNERDNFTREHAALALAKIKPTVESIHLALTQALTIEKDNFVRAKIAIALQEIRSQNSSIIQTLTQVLAQDKDPDVRVNVIYALAEARPNLEIVDLALAKALEDPYEVARRSAAYALGEIKPRSESIQLALAKNIVHDEDLYSRTSAQKALIKIRPGQKVIRYLKDHLDQSVDYKIVEETLRKLN